MVCKCDKIASLEALIDELGANNKLYWHAARQWVGAEKWEKVLTQEQRLNNIKLAKDCDDVRRTYLETFIW
jgi:hypothetical protein